MQSHFIMSANTTENKDFNTQRTNRKKKKRAQQMSKTIRDIYTARTI